MDNANFRYLPIHPFQELENKNLANAAQIKQTIWKAINAEAYTELLVGVFKEKSNVVSYT